MLRCNPQAEAQVEKKMPTGGGLGQLKLLEGFPKCLGQVREWDQVGLMGPLASAFKLEGILPQVGFKDPGQDTDSLHLKPSQPDILGRGHVW